MNYVFDIIIGGFLIGDAVLIGYLVSLVEEGRKAKLCALPIISIIASLTAFAVVFYGSFIEPRKIVTNEFTVQLKKNSSLTLRAAVVADMHVGPYKKDDFLTRAVEKINEQKPDIIFLVGDFVYDNAEQKKYLFPLKNLQAPYGVFAVLGNHDYIEGKPDAVRASSPARAESIKKTLEDMRIKVLVNESIDINMKGEKIHLYGIDELWTGNAKIAQSPSNNNLSIMLAHNPDAVVESEKAGYNLVISGHTHGGQIRLPFIGALSRIPTKLGRKFDRWLFDYGKAKLFITSGLGEVGPRARLFDPPEVDLLKINF